MSACTIITPAGKLRTQTTRRFIVVRWFEEPGRPFILYRTDDLGRARARQRKVSMNRTAIFDTITKEQIS